MKRHKSIRLQILAATAFALIANALSAKEPSETIEVWPDGVPGLHDDAAPERIENNRIVDIHFPSLDVYLPDSDVPATHTAVIFCPGGGYHHLTIGESGGPETQWLNSLGITVFVLKYRLLEYGHPAPMQDTLEAIRIARSQADRFGLDPSKIGVIGASAGGHAAACAATLWDHPDGSPEGSLRDINARPDFAILIYPVITMDPAFAHKGSRENLIGPTPAPELVKLLSIENQVRSDMPPVFLAATAADRSVPVENTLHLFQALRDATIPAEMHIYAQGSHGNSLDPQYGPTALWPRRAEEWLCFNGFLDEL